jgi:hypothetical protein
MKPVLYLTFLFLIVFNIDAQSTLEIDGTITVANSEGAPKAGAIRFNSSKKDFEGFDGTIWKSLTGSGLNGDGIFSGVTCYNGLARELIEINPAMDVDGDGDIDKAGAVVFASDFLVRPRNVDITYSINRSGNAADVNKLILILTCDDSATTIIEIHRWSGNTNLGHCETYILVQDPNNACQ